MNFSTTISLSSEDNSRYQAIYASQQYGTFYGLFGKFDIEKRGKRTLLHGIDLKLINYKGILNMSIETGPDSVALDEEARETVRDIPVILLKVEVRAKIQDPNYDSSLRLLKPIEVKKGTFFSVISEVLPISGHKDTKVPFVDGVFDNEFFFRDGLPNVERKITKIPLENGSKKDNLRGFKFQSKLLPKLDGRFGSIRCRVGNSKIITD